MNGGPSREGVEIVRRPMVVAPSSRRRLEERVAVRLPGVAQLVMRLVQQRLPLRSRLRQAVVGRAARLGFEAANRGDFEATFILYDPHVELIAEALEGLGWDGVYRGLEERVGFQRRWIAEWGDFRFVPDEMIYLGEDRMFFVGHVVGSGLSSGAAFDNFWANLLTVSAGLIVQEHFFFNRVDAFAAAGLDE